MASLFLVNCAPAQIAETPLTKRLEGEVLRLASTPRSTISIVGEAGTGKQAWARRLHAESARRAAPFVVVEAGAALDPAAIAAARGGTLFLREVTTLDPESHAHLADLLGQGDPDTARLIAAARRPLEDAVTAGSLPSDLEYRLNVLSLEVPALRERLGELGPLANHLAARLAGHLGFPRPVAVSPEAAAQLAAMDWPGNLHQLSWTLQGALISRLGGPNWPINGPLTPSEMASTSELSPSEVPQGSLEDLQEAAIRRALEAHGGNRSRAARELGIHRTTLYQKMRRYGLN